MLYRGGRNGYLPNLQARGLRNAKSGLVALLLPDHDNRFFSRLSQSFASEARERGLCPVIVATHRNPEEGRSTAIDLLADAIDQLFIAGAQEPDAISKICHDAQLPHVFIDQPSSQAPSVVTDNREGARGLTNLILGSMPNKPWTGREGVYFLGGNAEKYATGRRIEGFRAAMREAGAPCPDSHILPSTYEPEKTRAALSGLRDRLGGLPAGLFVNSISCFEGVLEFLGGLPEAEIAGCVLGCYDYDPLASLLRFPLHMVRQRHRTLIKTAYQLLDSTTEPTLSVVQPEIYPARPRK